METAPAVGTYEFSLTGGAANTKGTYTELIAATAFEAQHVIMTSGTATGNRRFLYDLAIGASGSEQIVLANVMTDSNSGSRVGMVLGVPLQIPAGSRLAARCQDSSGASVLGLHITLLGGPGLSPAPGRIDTCGAVTASTRGVAIDPGGSAHTFGAYAEVSAATTFDYAGIIVLISGKANPAPVSATFYAQLAIGAASSEQTVIPSLLFSSEPSIDAFAPKSWYYPGLAIPAGTRLSARGASSITDATDRLFELQVLGLGVLP